MKKRDEITISVIVPVRPESLVISKFLQSYFEMTKNLCKTELLLMVSKRSERNKDLFEEYKAKGVRIYVERGSYGQRGHHVYLNQLARWTKGDWIFSMCDDMIFTRKEWDDMVRQFIVDNELDKDKIYKVTPCFTDRGANQAILSRGYYEAVGRIYGYPNGDSWINTVMGYVDVALKEENKGPRTYDMQEPFIHDSHTTNLTALSRQEWHNLVKSGELRMLPFGSWGSEALEEEIRKEAGLIVKKIISEDM